MVKVARLSKSDPKISTRSSVHIDLTTSLHGVEFLPEGRTIENRNHVRDHHSDEVVEEALFLHPPDEDQ